MTTKMSEFRIAGLDEDGKIIALIADDQHGDFCLAIDIGDVQSDNKVAIQFDFASDNKIPYYVQEQMATKIVHHIFDTISRESNEE